ncbi:MAG TPA: hypothetical protein PKD34_01435 [Candidatus Doudnabacteria bacterium]|nr:hypothetical protein [Candidatus Doudnabacteria bacterium]
MTERLRSRVKVFNNLPISDLNKSVSEWLVEMQQWAVKEYSGRTDVYVGKTIAIVVDKFETILVPENPANCHHIVCWHIERFN